VESRQDLELSGAANDELITNLLFYLLLHDQNPGKRLKAVKLLQDTQPAQETKMVLVSALLTDSNPGIRLKSIRMLSTYEPGKIIQDACMKVLLEDENEAVRLSAMDIMEMAPNVSMIPALRVVSVLDENDFIRDRAQDLLRSFSIDDSDSRLEATS
jgi:HEAT repeat protein